MLMWRPNPDAEMLDTSPGGNGHSRQTHVTILSATYVAFLTPSRLGGPSLAVIWLETFSRACRMFNVPGDQGEDEV